MELFYRGLPLALLASLDFLPRLLVVSYVVFWFLFSAFMGILYDVFSDIIYPV